MYEAIRLGSLLGPQLFNGYHLSTPLGSATCVRGAAYLAIGDVERQTPFAFEIEKAIPDGGCPECGKTLPWGAGNGRPQVGGALMHLNDVHRWTREAIADWLEPIEEAYYANKEEVSCENA